MAYGSLLADVVQSSATGTPPQFNDTTGTQVGTLCRAWVNFNGTGTVAIRASFNVSSITDNGTGDYTVNFTNALSDANYSIGGAVGYGSGTAASTARWLTISSVTVPTSSACRVSTAYANGGIDDCLNVTVQIFR